MFFKLNSRYVYIVRCSDGTFYTGLTWNIGRRIEQHNGNLWGGAKYTESRRPVKIVHIEKFNSKRDALRREHEIKAMTHMQKEELIQRATKEAILSAI
jgi:putative endonuclease